MATLGVTPLQVDESQELRFSELKQGESIAIDFVSSGCFHHEHYELVFRRDRELQVTIREAQIVWEGNKVASESFRLLKSRNLNDQEAKGLDALLEFYRSKPRAAFTTIDTITVSHSHPAGDLTIEKFTDASGTYMIIEDLVKPRHEEESRIVRIAGKNWRSIVWLQNLIADAMNQSLKPARTD